VTSEPEMKWNKLTFWAVIAWPLVTDIIEEPILTGNLLQIVCVLIQLRNTTLKKKITLRNILFPAYLVHA